MSKSDKLAWCEKQARRQELSGQYNSVFHRMARDYKAASKPQKKKKAQPIKEVIING